MTNRQSIILQYENVVTKVNKLSCDTFLKTIGAEMNGPDHSKRRPYFLKIILDRLDRYIRYILDTVN